MTRKEAREETFILIFEKAFNDDLPEEILETAMQIRGFCADDYIRNAFFGVVEHCGEFDEVISKNSVGWSISRISKTALSVLRLALYEINYMEDIPESVSINEVVELCKKYATKEDASFVNGILATVVREKA